MDKKTERLMMKAADSWVRCIDDIPFFIENFCMLKDQARGRAIPFMMWPCQHKQVGIWQNNDLCITLKTRQIGISWLSAAFALHQILFKPYFKVMALSKKESDAIKYLEKIKFMYNHLPEPFQASIPIKHENRMMIELEYDEGLGVGGSVAFAESSNPEAGRSETLNLMIFDECAFIPDAESVWTAAEPTLEKAKGKAFFISTANGYDRLFQPTWSAAEDKENGFTRNFIAWDGDPSRDEEWYSNKKRQARAQSREREMKQEYPANPGEAFIVSGATFYAPEMIQSYLERKQKTYLRGNIFSQGILPNFVLSERGMVKVWSKPEHGEMYCAGIDSAEGVSEGDLSIMCVYNRRTREQVAEFAGRLDTESFSKFVFAIGQYYNWALLNIEMNSCGESILNFVHKQKRYPHIFRQFRYDELQKKKVKKLGWRTTATSKRVALDALDSFLREHEMTPWSEGLFDEMKTFCIQQTEWGNYTYRASGRNHDDRVMAHSIAAIVLQEMPLTGGSKRNVRPQYKNRFEKRSLKSGSYNLTEMFS